LQVRNLAVRFGAVRALAGVDLDVAPGEIVAIAGENGAGKSTLVRCIAGDMAPTIGEIRLDGQRVPPDPAAAGRLGVGVVWQDLALCDNLDIAANLLLGRERRGLMLSDTRFHAAASRVLAELRVPLPDTSRSVQTLSGGQRQLLAVARAVRDRPRLLVLDEPTAALGVTWSAQVEELTARLRRDGTSILLVTHDIEQMLRLADRIAVLQQGRIVSDVDPGGAHPDDIVALMSGQQIDVSPRRQLDRLHGLVDQLASAEPSSSLTLIVTALGAALGTDRLCVHLAAPGPASAAGGAGLRLAASSGLPPGLAGPWQHLPTGPAGGPVGLAASTEAAVIDADVRTSPAWTRWRDLAGTAEVGSSWAVPVVGSNARLGVITVLRRGRGRPTKDELDLTTLYAGYVASAVERERLLAQLTARNQVLETIREVLEAVAGPISLSAALDVALGALQRGLGADTVGLAQRQPDGQVAWRAAVGAGRDDAPPPAGSAMWDHPVATPAAGASGRRGLSVGLQAPAGRAVLLAWWSPFGRGGGPDAAGASLLEDAARSLQLALEREEAERAHRETRALRRSQELQRRFLSRLSHELRTPLTAIRGYASSLLQPDVTWDGDSEERFLQRIAGESARVGRLVDDLLDFSVIESDILRLQRDWCDLALVVEAAVACLPPDGIERVAVACQPDLPPIWGDHDRLEQVLVNLLANSLRHNPDTTKVRLDALEDGGDVVVHVADDGIGLPADVRDAPFALREGRSRTGGAGLGLSITKGIVDAHGGSLTLCPEPPAEAGAGAGAPGTHWVIRLPIEPVEPVEPEGAGSDA